MLRRYTNLVGFGLLTLTLVGSSAEAASEPSHFCEGNPCVVSGSITAEAGSELNFGGRSLVFASNARIDLGPGALPRVLTFIAGDITMEPGALIRGFDDDEALVTLEATSGAVVLQSSGATRSEINVKADDIDAGSIVISAATDAIIDGRLTASATGEDAAGGSIEIEAGGAVTISQTVTTEGSGLFAGAGSFDIDAGGDVSISGRMIADGADFGGGDVIVVSRTGSVTISSVVSNNGGSPDGEAGEFDISAQGDIRLSAGAELRGRGGKGADDDCGDGATMFLTTTLGSIFIAGEINVNGGYQCFGGEIDIESGLDFEQVGNGKIFTDTAGGYGAGGPVEISAERDVSLLKIDASASGGFGGDILVTANGTITVNGQLNASASGEFGVASRIILEACTINVLAPDGELRSQGTNTFVGFGRNELRIRGSGDGILTGKLYASREDPPDEPLAVPKNLITYREGQPVFAGVADPPITFVQDETLLECVNSCGDGIVAAPEVCDDGNTQSCDGCSRNCLPDNVCGDGIVECGEQCDDGNEIPGDGCENDCTPSGQAEEGVFIQSRGTRVGCQAQWRVKVPNPLTDKKGKPANKQRCIDGDHSCDLDGEINDSCSFEMQACVNLPDDDLPNCDAARRVNRVRLMRPLKSSRNAWDQINAQNLLEGLKTLGTTVEAEGITLQTGAPVDGLSVCGAKTEVVIPLAGKAATKNFKLRSANENGQVMKKGQVELTCERNESICGDGLAEPGELCDDGNANACDGCFLCRTETCGNGILDCGEQCDAGLLNGAEGSRCSPQCTIVAPELRIPGGGGKGIDCMFQWSTEMDTAQVFRNKAGVPRARQFCFDGNPGCDFDTTPGNCRMRVFACVGEANETLGCAATSVDDLTLRRPKSSARAGFERAARNAVLEGLGSLNFPAEPGEGCSTMIELNIPRGETLRLSTKAFGARDDGDSLRLTCQ